MTLICDKCLVLQSWRNVRGSTRPKTCSCGGELFLARFNCKTGQYELPAFGWDVEVQLEFNDGTGSQVLEFHFRGCSQKAAERKARRKAILMRHCSAVGILGVEPLTKQQWVGAYGLGRM